MRVPLWIGHCHPCMKGRLKLRLQSPFMEYCLGMLLINFFIFRFWRRYTHISPLLWIVGLTGTGIGYSPLAEIIYWSYLISGSFFIHLPLSPSIKYREAFHSYLPPPQFEIGKLSFIKLLSFLPVISLILPFILPFIRSFSNSSFHLFFQSFFFSCIPPSFHPFILIMKRYSTCRIKNWYFVV